MAHSWSVAQVVCTQWGIHEKRPFCFQSGLREIYIYIYRCFVFFYPGYCQIPSLSVYFMIRFCARDMNSL